MDVDNILTSLTCNAKLDRDKAVKSFETTLPFFTETDVQQSCDFILTKLSSSSESWEVEHGCLSAAKVLITSHNKSAIKLPDGFCSSCEDACFALLADKEFRVRDLSDEVIGALAVKFGPALFERRRDVVLSNIRSLLEKGLEQSGLAERNNRRQRRCSSPSPTRDYSDGCIEGEAVMAGSFQPRPSSPLHDKETLRRMTRELDQWKALEIWSKCLACIVEGIGSQAFSAFVDDTFLNLLCDLLSHKDRYVRETGFQIVASLIEHKTEEENGTDFKANGGFEHLNSSFRDKIAAELRIGLSDNWSHVRLAACIAARNFFLSLKSETERLPYYSIFLPPLCLNRYHLAEGVRSYSQETWKLVTNGEGKVLVERFLTQVVDFYIEQCEAKNHAVREAACACIAELAVKMSTEIVCEHVSRLLDALLVCFNDDSWPVRDGACQACSKFISNFPTECRPKVNEIISLMGENLRDNIASVRAGAALALATTAKTYNSEIKAEIVEKYLFSGLEACQNQPSDAQRSSQPKDVSIVMNEQVGDACNTHLRRFCRPAEPWEITDGSICLFVEISPLLSPNEVAKCVELIVTATNKRDYSQHSALLSTLCKQLPELAKKLGKQAFKANLESFFDTLFYCVDHQHLALVAGENCIIQLCKIIGPSVFRGRVQNYNPNYIKLLDKFVPPTY